MGDRGDTGLRCLTCLGKLGPPIAELRCEFCCLLFRLQDLVVSDRFPGAAIRFVTPELRGAYYRALEIADSYLHTSQGGRDPPRVEDKGAAGAEAPNPRTRPKGGSPPKEKAAEEATSSRPKEEERSPEKIEKTKEEAKEKKSKKKDKKKKTKVEENTPEPASSVRRSRSRRSRSRRSRRSREGRSRDRREEQGYRSERVSPERIERKTRSREGRRREEEDRDIQRRSPLRPRSPPGPPPPRPPGERRWEGPIPSYQNRPRDPELRVHREARNKGAKKRRQQALFGEFKAWRKRHRGHPHY